MSRLTLSQARERIAALTGPASLIDPEAIDWTQPDREAVTLAGLVQSTADFGERANIVAVCLALLAYQSHLDHEAGQAFELAAVKRFVSDGKQAMGKTGDVGALMAFSCLLDGLATGVHHAEPAAPRVQSFDVWLSADMVPTEVRCVLDTGNLVVSDLYGNRGHRVVSADDFTSNRRLVKRDGKAV